MFDKVGIHSISGMTNNMQFFEVWFMYKIMY